MASTEEDIRAQIEAEIMDDRLAGLAERLGATAGASAVFGAPVEQDGVTVVPVARARWGVGGGSGRGKGKKGGDERGAGLGGGVDASPVGFIELGPAGVEYRRINDPLRYMAVLLFMPFIIAVSFVMVMVAAATIGGLMMRRGLAMAANFRMPLPHLTFRSQ